MVVSFVLTTAAVVACGSGAATPGSNPDSGAATIPSSATCGGGVQLGGKCTADDACCLVMVPDSFGPDGYRCLDGTWKSDPACVPVPVCDNPLSGSLSRASGSQLSVTCVRGLAVNGVVGVTLDVGSAKLELAFDRLPVVGEVVQLVAGARPQLIADAGADAAEAGSTSAHAGFRVGSPGGIAGFDVQGVNDSGTLTVTAITTDPSGAVTSLHASIDAQTRGESDPSWNGKLTGSW